MLHTTNSPEQKRVALRAGLASNTILQLPGAFNALSARLIQKHNFEGVYVSGAVVAADLGLPDIGLTTSSEVSQRAAQIGRMTDLPTLVDADTGFGEVLNLARTIQLFEDAGVSALHIEDQVNPKRCGHLDGKTVVDDSIASKRIASAVAARRDPNLVIMARTDIRGTSDIKTTIDRIKMLGDAGADAIFPEALASLAEFEAVRGATNLPILANMTEFGKSELFSLDELRNVGVNLVIYPVSLLRVAMGASERALLALRSEGSFRSEVAGMQTRADLYDLVNYEGYGAFDDEIYNFDLDSQL
ncbi:methylisocitrate lyase [Candidatus Aquiluna sp. UB-MaderosW2red]|uniref:methylisocitrate lyase n=1 Tax=Candidatus Aquiluna sp. UB-MaderosW2red TaxID=1855377 RepID=UPI000875C4BF|nr:methylisocitrate lyase [Candidatus Aquiluna sp. UB-MaderosW2red]SCX05433.1 methylisocitrate lyase [Candidatus Aquiluna sp. UB-MaderosW2red]